MFSFIYNLKPCTVVEQVLGTTARQSLPVPVAFYSVCRWVLRRDGADRTRWRSLLKFKGDTKVVLVAYQFTFVLQI